MIAECATSSCSCSLPEPSGFNKNFSEWYYWGSVIWWGAVDVPTYLFFTSFKALYYVLYLGHPIMGMSMHMLKVIIQLYPSRPEDVLFVLLKAIPVIDSINALALNPTPGISLGEWGGALMGPGWGQLTKCDLYLLKKGLEFAYVNLDYYNTSIPIAFDEYSYIKPKFVSLLDSEEDQLRMKQLLAEIDVYKIVDDRLGITGW